MSTPRIPPVPPNKAGELDKSSPSEHRKVEKVEKISKIAEVDDESRARQKFRQFVDAEPEEESNLPNPFTLFSKEEPVSSVSFSRSMSFRSAPPPTLSTNDPILAEAAETALPSPTYSAPPSASLGGTAIDDEENNAPLPRSQQFWQNAYVPSDSSEPNQQPQMDETPRSASRVFATDDDETVQKRKKTSRKGTGELYSEDTEEPTKQRKEALSERGKLSERMDSSPFGPPGKPTLGKKEGAPYSKEERPSKDKKLAPGFAAPMAPLEGAGKGTEEERLPFLSEERGTKRTGPEGVIIPKGKEGFQYIAPLNAEEQKQPEYRGPLPEERASPQAVRGLPPKRSAEVQEEVRKEERELRAPIRLKEERTTVQEKREDERERKQAGKEEMESLQIESPTLIPLPEFVIPLAGAAASAATPYLGPEALAIYFHMIGTITAMVSPRGDSRTEFVLNAPSFANSKFYGATISIERFATAPYQLNIRLTGSNEAVNQFNQNIPNLLAAFQRGNFSFTVNRIEAVYEKPLFRRKEGAGEKGEKDQGFGGGMDNRKKR